VSYIPESLRRLVFERAEGHCEYCLLAVRYAYFPYEIDHIIAEKHGGQTDADNLCLSCFECNRYKGSDLASYDEDAGEIVRLFHPRRDQWIDHFRVEAEFLLPLTPIGRVTVKLLQLNKYERLLERAELVATGKYP
jgi:hypothetical protein